MEQVALGSSLNELYFGILTVQNGSAELPVALLLYMGEVKFPRIFGAPILNTIILLFACSEDT